MKNPFKTLAKRLVTAESNRIFRKAIMLAEKRHNEEGKRIYVIEIIRKELNPIYVSVDGKDYTIAVGYTTAP